MATIAQLAVTMNTTEAQLSSYVACLKVWTDKGYTVEEAIGQHELTMAKLLQEAMGCYDCNPNRDRSNFNAFKKQCADAVWEACN